MPVKSNKMNDSERAAAEKNTQGRKDANVAKNEARHQANLAYIKEHGLTGFSIEKTVTVRTKVKNLIVEKEKLISRPAAPGTIVQRHKNSLDNSRHLAWQEAQKGSPLPAEYSTAQHIRAKERAQREKALQIVTISD